MGLIQNDCFICLDLETTGLDPEREKIIEIAAVRFTFNKILDTFETLINPLTSIPESSIAIHHITDDMVKGQPTIEEVLPRLFAFIGNQSQILIGHGVSLDIAFLVQAAHLHHIPCHLSSMSFIDTLRMARLYGESPTNSLEMLREHFNIARVGPHRAMNDVLVNIEVFKFLAARYKTTQELIELLKKPILLKAMPLGKYKGRAFSDIPIEYLLGAAKADFDQDLLYSIRSEIKRRKKGNVFEQAANPFSEL